MTLKNALGLLVYYYMPMKIMADSARGQGLRALGHLVQLLQ